MPRKSPHAQVDNKFYTTARPSQSRHKKNKLSRSKSPQDKDGLKVKIREDFVIPRRDRNDQGVFTDEYLDAYKRKLFSERRAFDAAYSRDGDSDESKHDSLQSKSLSLRQFTISRAVPQNDIQSRHNTPRHKEDAYDNPQSTLRKVQSTLQREDATQDAAQGGGSPSEPHGGAHARLKEDPADFKASTDNPSIGTVPSSHSDDGKKDLDLNLPSKQPEPQTKPPEEDTGKSPFVYNDIPSSTSPGKHKIDPHKYNPIIVSKKQTPIDKRVTYLSMKLKSIQLTPDDEITEKNIDHNKTESISKVSGIEDSFIEGYAPGLAAYNPPKKNDETTAPESGDIDKVGALLDMGLSVEPDSKAKDKKELDNPYTETPAPASGVLQSEARSNGRYSENGNSSARRLSDSKEKKSPKTRSKRISSVFSKMSENVARRSSNIRDSLIKRLNENIASFPTKSSSSKNSQQESQNDYFIISESDSKQNT